MSAKGIVTALRIQVQLEYAGAEPGRGRHDEGGHNG